MTHLPRLTPARLLLCAALLALTSAGRAGAAEGRVLKDLPYKIGDRLTDYERQRCKLDLYLPGDAANKPFPVVVFFHGGGLTAGDKGDAAAFGKRLAADAIAVASAEYRLSPKATYPAYNQDAAAVALVTDNNGNFTRQLTNAAGQTIDGYGQLGVNQINVVNAGVISADSAGNTLTVDPTAALSNSGTLRADVGGTLALAAGTYSNAGTIEALTGGTVTPQSGATLTNNVAGTLTGGTYRSATTGAASVLVIPGGNVMTNAATVELSGANSQFAQINPLATNLAAGTFRVLGGRTFTTGGAFSNSGAVVVGAASTLATPAASAYFQDAGSTLVNGTLDTALTSLTGGTLYGTGTLTGDLDNGVGVLVCAAVSPGPLAAPGAVGTLTVNGDYTQTNDAMGGAMLAIELAGLLPGSGYDVLNIGGTADLAGTLDVTLLNGFNPTAGETFTILNAVGGVSGVFDTATLPAGFSVAYLPTSVLLTAPTAPVPEPASLAVLGLFGGGLLLRRRRTANA